MKRTVLSLLFILMLGSMNGCLNDIEEVQIDLPEDDVSVPTGLSAQVDNAKVMLTWDAAAGGASAYRIYRSSGERETARRITETAATSYLDTNVRNGQAYRYSVSTVGAHGLEGERSAEVEAVPGIYTVIIDGGRSYTGSENVNLTLTAPATTTLMMISNDVTLADAAWEPYAVQAIWDLSDGDGSKSVYAVFQDGNGSISPVVVDSIVLDTYARITGLTISPETYVYGHGETVHFSMYVEDNEPGGEAYIRFDVLSENFALDDEARAGDVTAHDGVYEADICIPERLRGTDMTVTAVFTDRVGNRAPAFDASQKISITDPPDPVLLVGVDDSTTNSITIRWVASIDEHFSAYRIYRSESPGIEELPGEEFPDPRYLIKQLGNRDQTTYPDQGLTEGETYYYRIFVANDLFEAAGSREISAQTHDAYPQPVVLDSLSSIGTDRVTLTWSMNQNTDFAEYRIYRDTKPGVTCDELLRVAEPITEREITYFDDSGLNLGSYTYYYRICVFDRAGKHTRSNEVSTEP